MDAVYPICLAAGSKRRLPTLWLQQDVKNVVVGLIASIGREANEQAHTRKKQTTSFSPGTGLQIELWLRSENPSPVLKIFDGHHGSQTYTNRGIARLTKTESGRHVPSAFDLNARRDTLFPLFRFSHGG